MNPKFQLGANSLPTIRFRYVNWRGDEHTYVINIESIEFGPYVKSGLLKGARAVWVMSGHVVTRDEITRLNPGGARRTFIMSGMFDVEVVE